VTPRSRRASRSRSISISISSVTRRYAGHWDRRAESAGIVAVACSRLGFASGPRPINSTMPGRSNSGNRELQCRCDPTARPSSPRRSSSLDCVVRKRRISGQFHPRRSSSDVRSTAMFATCCSSQRRAHDDIDSRHPPCPTISISTNTKAARVLWLYVRNPRPAGDDESRSHGFPQIKVPCCRMRLRD